jgi:hypothetical protein
MKTLKDYVWTFARPEGSIAEGYAMEETLGFCTEYMSRFSTTRRRVWDAIKEQSMVDEVLEGKGVHRCLINFDFGSTSSCKRTLSTWKSGGGNLIMCYCCENKSLYLLRLFCFLQYSYECRGRSSGLLTAQLPTK